MSKSTVRKFGFLGLPLIAVAVLVAVMAWGFATPRAEANTAAKTAMSLSVTSGSVACPPEKDPAHVCAIVGQKFNLVVSLDKVPAGGHIGFGTQVDYSALVAGGGEYQETVAATAEIVIPTNPGANCNYPGIPVRSPAAPANEGLVSHGGTQGTPPFTAGCMYTGPLVQLSMKCGTGESTNQIDLVPLSGPNPLGSGVKQFQTNTNIPASDSLTVNCVQAPTPTPLPPTPTPPDFPQMQKLPAQQNLWLTRQDDAKIPPINCAAGDDTATLSESLSIPIPALVDPKDPGTESEPNYMELGAFEFEIHFDDTKVCVNIVPATEAGEAAENMICFVEDKDSSTLEGVARIGCVTSGKDNFPDTTTEEGRHLADIVVRPQPDEYSVVKPNQDNGNTVQLSNVLCELSDLQSHPIPVFSCEDADVTIRYLEGDVEPDCDIGVLDTQAIAFRWGAEKGSQVYTDFMNLEPSGTQADADIDIKDLQFVYGRFGSDCDTPHPPQEPVNPKA